MRFSKKSEYALRALIELTKAYGGTPVRRHQIAERQNIPIVFLEQLLLAFTIGSVVPVGISLFAAFVNGALGYGFSSLTVPVALVFYTNRILNPALVLIEVLINLYVLFINRASVPAVWNRVYPILIGLLPGIAVGSYLLASLHPSWIKFVTYTVLLPLILVQAGGIRRPIQSERLIGLPFGAGLGFLYSVTTVSGPPLAILFNNQGLVKREFRAGLGLIRVAESSLKIGRAHV